LTAPGARTQYFRPKLNFRKATELWLSALLGQTPTRQVSQYFDAGTEDRVGRRQRPFLPYQRPQSLAQTQYGELRADCQPSACPRGNYSGV